MYRLTYLKLRCAMLLIHLPVHLYVNGDRLQMCLHRNELLQNAGSMKCEFAARNSASVIDAVCSFIVMTTLSSCRLGLDNNPLLVCLIAAAIRVWEYIRFI